MDNLKKKWRFHGNHGSLATVKFEINVFLCGPMGTLYVSHRFDINMWKHCSMKLNLLYTTCWTSKLSKMAANTGKLGYW